MCQSGKAYSLILNGWNIWYVYKKLNKEEKNKLKSKYTYAKTRQDVPVNT